MRKSIVLAVLVATACLLTTAATAKASTVIIRMMNLTNGQEFSAPVYAVGPCVAARTLMFADGLKASVALEQMAEGGITYSLVSLLQSKGWKVVVGVGKILSGNTQSVSVPVPTLTSSQSLCMAVITKLVQTNDGFIAFQNFKVVGNSNIWFYPEAFDAGTEKNDELCTTVLAGNWSCGSTMGQGFNSYRWPGERIVTVHTGIAGFGNLKPMDVGFNPLEAARLLFLLQ